MTHNTENLVLEHLKHFQAGQRRIEHKLDEHTQRLGRIEIALAVCRICCIVFSVYLLYLWLER